MKKIEEMTEEELDSYLANKAKERERYYREEATEEEKEKKAQRDAYLASVVVN